MELNEFEQLIGDFDLLPKVVKQPTYLELCKYPRRRFEEICSRLLCFYLAPQKEHGFNDLFLGSLLQLVAPGKEFFLQAEKIHVNSEENAEGKRLDLLIYSDTFVIGIENKITAGLYNPLETYKNRIDLYNPENRYRVILSLKRITIKDDLAFIHSHGFINVTYADYFDTINDNLGLYLGDCNKKYHIYLLDFIQTLENMIDTNILNEELSSYFFDNSKKIDELIELYNQYNNNSFSKHKERIAELKEKICELTGNEKWWIWEEWDLGFNEFDANKPKIGIESSFETTKGNPLGLFHIYITTWNLNDWNYYEQKVLSAYPTADLKKLDNRAILKVESIENDDEELILQGLKKHYDYLVTITSVDGMVNN